MILSAHTTIGVLLVRVLSILANSCQVSFLQNLMSMLITTVQMVESCLLHKPNTNTIFNMYAGKSCGRSLLGRDTIPKPTSPRDTLHDGSNVMTRFALSCRSPLRTSMHPISFPKVTRYRIVQIVMRSNEPPPSTFMLSLKHGNRG
jgi:hypothetical protein